KLYYLNTYEALTKDVINELVSPLLSESQKELLENNKGLDFSFGYGGGDYGDKGRFRINLYYQKGTLAAACRLLPQKIKTIEELSLPSVCHAFSKLKQGF